MRVHTGTGEAKRQPPTTARGGDAPVKSSSAQHRLPERPFTTARLPCEPPSPVHRGLPRARLVPIPGASSSWPKRSCSTPKVWRDRRPRLDVASPQLRLGGLVARQVVLQAIALLPALLRAADEGLLGITVAEHDVEEVVVGPTDDVGTHGRASLLTQVGAPRLEGTLPSGRLVPIPDVERRSPDLRAGRVGRCEARDGHPCRASDRCWRRRRRGHGKGLLG